MVGAAIALCGGYWYAVYGVIGLGMMNSGRVQNFLGFVYCTILNDVLLLSHEIKGRNNRNQGR